MGDILDNSDSTILHLGYTLSPRWRVLYVEKDHNGIEVTGILGGTKSWCVLLAMGEGNQFEGLECDFSYGRLSRRCCESEWSVTICKVFVYTAHIYENTTQSMLTLFLSSHLFTLITPLTRHSFNKTPQCQRPNRRYRKGSRPFYKSSFFSKRKKRINGSLMRSVSFSNQTFAFSWMLVLSRPNEYLSSMEKLLISTRMLEKIVERLWLWRGNTDGIFLILSVAAQNFKYKMSNILDKPLYILISFFTVDFFRVLIKFHIFVRNWSFGYITVLSGAVLINISWQNDPTGKGQLQTYFLGESMVISLFYFVPKICWICLFGCSTAQALIILLLTCISLRIVSFVRNHL